MRALVKQLLIGPFGFSKRSGKEQLMLRYFKGQYNILKLFSSSFWPALAYGIMCSGQLSKPRLSPLSELSISATHDLWSLLDLECLYQLFI